MQPGFPFGACKRNERDNTSPEMCIEKDGTVMKNLLYNLMIVKLDTGGQSAIDTRASHNVL
jgi:hypothetical protein